MLTVKPEGWFCAEACEATLWLPIPPVDDNALAAKAGNVCGCWTKGDFISDELVAAAAAAAFKEICIS